MMGIYKVNASFDDKSRWWNWSFF